MNDHTAQETSAPRLEVPFLPSEPYLELLDRHAARIACLHVGLSDPLIHDARHLYEEPSGEPFLDMLATVGVADRYVLLNSRFLPPGTYSDPLRLDHITTRLESLLERDLVRGIVHADLFLLQALSDHSPETASALEAVPSINCCLDSPDKLAAHLEILSATRFRMPLRIVADRSLNRMAEAREALRNYMARHLPQADMVLMANEGCLPHCPFKQTHDALGAYCRSSGQESGSTLARLGCVRHFVEKPWLCLASPIIRPEDQRLYDESGTVLKLCGRSLGPKRMAAIVRAYIRERHQGNLLDVLDAQDMVRQRVEIDNHGLPPEYGRKTLNCSMACHACGYCRELFRKVGRLHGGRILPLETAPPA